MANALEFNPSGHPIENRYDGYGGPDQEAQDRPPFPVGATLEYLGSRTGARIGHCPQGHNGPTYWQDAGTVCNVVATHDAGWSHEDDPACSVVEWPGGNKTIIWPDDSDLWATRTAQDTDRITRQIDEKRAAFLASGVADDYDPFAPIETDEERQERRLAEMDAWGEAYGCLDDDQDDEVTA